MKTLLELVDVRDPRGGGGRRKHVFKEILAIAILAKLSGAQTFNEMEEALAKVQFRARTLRV